MKAGFLAACPIAFLAISLPANSQSIDPSEAVRTCISTHAAAVEKTVASLKDATEFLVSQVCLESISADSMALMKARQAEQRAELEKKCAGQQAPSPGAYDPKAAMCANLDMGMDASMMTLFYDGGTYLAGGGPAFASATSLAAQTLLKLRSAKVR